VTVQRKVILIVEWSNQGT